MKKYNETANKLRADLYEVLEPIFEVYPAGYDDCFLGSYDLQETLPIATADGRLSEEQKKAIETFVELYKKFNEVKMPTICGFFPSNEEEWKNYLSALQAVVDAAPNFVSAMCAYAKMFTPASV